MKYLIGLLILGALGCVDREALPVHSKENDRTEQKFHFHDQVSMELKFLGKCTGVINNAPWWGDYCGHDGTPQWVYPFGSVTCDGERRNGVDFVCEKSMKLLKRKGAK